MYCTISTLHGLQILDPVQVYEHKQRMVYKDLDLLIWTVLKNLLHAIVLQGK